MTIRPESSIDFFQKLRAQNVKVDLHLIQGAPHEFQRDSPDAALLSAQAANLFFDRLVINPKEYPPFGAGRGGGARGGRPVSVARTEDGESMPCGCLATLRRVLTSGFKGLPGILLCLNEDSPARRLSQIYFFRCASAWRSARGE